MTRSVRLFIIPVLFSSLSSYIFADSISDTVTITAIIESNSGNTPVNNPPPSSGTSGGVGGAIGGVMLNTATTDSAIFRGIAYPGAIVSLLQNGVIIREVVASPNGTFEIKLQGISTGTYTYGVRAEDSHNRKSPLQVFTIFISQGVSVVVDGVVIPPTITTDKIETIKGEPILFSGSSIPNSKVTLTIHSATELIKKVITNINGAWFYTLETTNLSLGEYDTKAFSITSNDLSLYSDTILFTVGKKNRLRTGNTVVNKRCDLNNDKRVNLLDFSIMAFWYKRLGFPDKVDLNSDKKIDLSDVSILAYCWTG